MTRTLVIAGAMFGVLSLASVVSWAQPATPASLTPGKTALLVNPAGEKDIAALTAALVDSDPNVRAVAARVAAVLRIQRHAPQLLEQLTREQHDRAGAEQVRALLAIKKLEVVPEVIAAAIRLRGATRAVVVEWLARNAPRQLVSSMAQLVENVDPREADRLARIVGMGLLQTPAERDSLLQAWLGAVNGTAWDDLLIYLAESGHVTWPAKDALTSADPSVRERSVWFILSRLARHDEPSQHLLASLASPVPEDETEWAQVGRELLKRRFHKTQPEDRSAAIRERRLTHSRDHATLTRLDELTAAELKALAANLGDQYEDRRSPSRDQEQKPPQRRVTARHFQAMFPGFISAVMEAANCRLRERYDNFAGARVLYETTGRPRELVVDGAAVTPQCVIVIETLARLSVADADQPLHTITPIWQLLPLDKAIVACIDTPDESPVDIGGAEGVRAPKKTKNVNPVYPEAARVKTIQGTVIVEAMISTTGCVRDVRVVESRDVFLDTEALRAVSQWRYEPTLLNGKAVPVFMTVSVNFRLQ